jgi:hypothetical protein
MNMIGWSIRVGAGELVLLAGLTLCACSRSQTGEDVRASSNEEQQSDYQGLVSGAAKGVLDSHGSTSHVAGWAWDPMQPDLPVVVEIYEEGTLLGTVRADRLRADLPGNRQHGFRFPLPGPLQDGKAHPISVRIARANIELRNSPQPHIYAPSEQANKPAAVNAASFQTPRQSQGGGDAKPPTKKPERPLVSSDATGSLLGKGKVSAISGWAWDPTQPDLAVAVDIYEGKNLLGTVLANKHLPHLIKVTKDKGNHGFRYPFPASMRDGKAYVIAVKISGANIELKNSPQTLTYTPPAAKTTKPATEKK